MSSTGQAVGYVVGAVAGYFTGGSSYVLMGAAIGGAVGAALDPPKGPNLQGPRLSDLSGQTSDYGTVIPRVYGTVGLYGNVFWLENNALKEVATTKESGGKGGGGGATTTTYSYYATFAVGLCRGEIAGLRRLWVGSQLIYDAGTDDLESIIAGGGSGQYWTLYKGSEDQQPDPRMQAAIGVSDTPAYRGLAYLVFKDYPLQEHGNSLLGAQVKAEVVSLPGDIATLVTARQVPKAATAHPSNLAAGTPMTADGESVFIETSPAGQPFVTYLVRVGKQGTFRGRLLDYAPLAPDGSQLLAGGAWKSINALSASFINDEFAFTLDRRYFIYGRSTAIKAYDLGVGTSLATAYAEGSDADFATIFINLTNRYLVRLPKVVGNVAETNQVALGATEKPAIAAWGNRVLSVQKSTATGGLLLVKVYDATLALLDSWSVTFPIDVDIDSGDCTAIVDGDVLYVMARGSASGAAFAAVDLLGKQVLSSYTPPTGFSGTDTSPRSPSVARRGSAIGWGDRTSEYFRAAIWRIDAIDFSSRIPLSQIVVSETLQSKILTGSDIHASALTQGVVGYRVGSLGAIRSAIEPLQGVWPFDVIQDGYIIRFVPRGATSVASVDESELAARPASEKTADRLTIMREMDTQLPMRVSIKYLDAGREYAQNEQYAERLGTDAVNQRVVDVPVVLTADEAAAMAEKLLYLYWLERYDLKFTLPPDRRALCPGDVITLSLASGQSDVRITGIQYQSNGVIDVSARYSRPAVYESSAVGATGNAGSSIIPLQGSSIGVYIDGPCLADQMNSSGFIAAACGKTSGWPGAVLMRSGDGEASWDQVAAYSRPGSAIGIAANALAAPAQSALIDSANSLTVGLYAGELFSVSELQMLNGANHFALGVDGRWEIIAARSCVLQADGTYILSDLLRGRFGTEWAMSTHQIGDMIVLLNAVGQSFIDLSSDAIGLVRRWRMVTLGNALESADSADFAYRGVNLECLSPVYLNGSRAASGDWSLSWLRRTRVGGEWRDYIDAPLGEASEVYEVEIYTSAAYTTLKRTITGLTTASATYTSAQQVADFGSNQATLYVKVYQLSANVGRGYPLTTSITR